VHDRQVVGTEDNLDANEVERDHFSIIFALQMRGLLEGFVQDVDPAGQCDGVVGGQGHYGLRSTKLEGRDGLVHNVKQSHTLLTRRGVIKRIDCLSL
jgi:hypothetical protein